LNRMFSIVAALLLAAAAFGANPPSKAKVHGLSVTGTVASIEEAGKKMVVKTALGKQVALVWTGATKTVGGSVKAGVKVTVRYLEKDGKNIATSIQIVPDKALEAAAPTPAAATPTAAASNDAKNR
jgi:hypothetical protein